MKGMLAGAVATVCACSLPPAAAAAGLPASFQAPCPTTNPAGESYGGVRICSGQVPSWDGSKLDVDVTQPTTNGPGRHPVIVMLHGFGNNKHEWESTTDEADGADKYHWNNRWLAKHGYYVINYTARGFRDDGPSEAYQPPTPNGTSVDLTSPSTAGTLHLKSRDFEVRDTQWLAALVAAGFPDVDPSKVAVTGGSYGGGESWVQASQSQWTFPHRCSRPEENPDLAAVCAANAGGPKLPVLQLQVAVPKYPWTDLAYALAPNGHGGGPTHEDLYESSQGDPSIDTGDGNPIGNTKLSYIAGLFALGARRGVFEEGQTNPAFTGEEGPINIPLWNKRMVVDGDPYDVNGAEDPVVKQVRRGLTEFRSSYYQNEGWAAQANGRKVAVFSISGWTDDLFPPVESFRQFKYLKRLDPRWPVEVAVGDVGHSRAGNPPAQWRRLNAQAFQWLQAHIRGSHEQVTTVSSQPTFCTNDGEPDRNDNSANEVTATSPEGLANGALTIRYRGGSTSNPPDAADPNGPATDPVAGDVVVPGEDCRTSRGPAPYTDYSPPLKSTTTYIGLGEVDVPYVLSGQTATLNARVWDVSPNGDELLMTRGTYRLDVPAYDQPAGTLRLPLFGNHWRLKPGHRIRLDLTQVDAATFRPSNEPSTIAFPSGPTLKLPTLEAGSQTLAR